mmetsp:Transcript_10659/g.32071  ORF Transcript_10659/g.32071 Transcript_10659/m.32071 type:complete len:216 (-) Transcript_10659:1113-1760(-)
MSSGFTGISSHEAEARRAKAAEQFERSRARLATREDGCVDLAGDGRFRSVKKTIRAGDAEAQVPVPLAAVRVHYTGWLLPTTGDAAPVLSEALVAEVTAKKPFDTSRARGRAFSFTLKRGDVILGWDLGLSTMRVGERAHLVLAPDHGYGARGAPPVIPPHSWLFFDVELLDVTAPDPNRFHPSQLVAGLVALTLVVYYCFFFHQQKSSDDGGEL